jgi:hypothetical protein
VAMSLSKWSFERTCGFSDRCPLAPIHSNGKLSFLPLE